MCMITECDNCGSSIEQKDGKIVGITFGEKGLCFDCFDPLVRKFRRYEETRARNNLINFREEVREVVEKSGIYLGQLLKRINRFV